MVACIAHEVRPVTPTIWRWAWLLACVYGALAVLTVVALMLLTARPARAAGEDVTSSQVDDWIVAYSVQRSSSSYPYDALVTDVRRVANCESGYLNVDVINGRRKGARGEVGVFQFLPGPRSIFWATESAAAGWTYTDAEANVAAAVELISRGYGPRHWSCW